MTRWKLEFRLWAAREKLIAFSVPKDWRDWDKAKVFSRMIDGIARRPEVQARVQKAMEDLIIFGYANDPDDFSPSSISTWIH